MFTGLVTDVGQIRHVEKRGDTHVVIATHYDVADIAVGASIACSGICLTVVDKGGSKDRWFAVTASGETLSKTTVGQWKAGDPGNLRRPHRVAGPVRLLSQTQGRRVEGWLPCLFCSAIPRLRRARRLAPPTFPGSPAFH